MKTINFNSFFKKKKIKKSENMVVFVQSYPNLINTLYLMKNSIYYNETSICVIKNINLYKFLITIKDSFNNKINISHIEDDEISFTSIYEFLKSFIKKKKVLKKISLNYKFNNCDIYFFSRSFTTLGLFLLKANNYHNKFIHIPDPGCDVYKIKDSKPKSFKQLILILIYKLLYGKELVYGYAGRKLNTPYFFKISDNFFDKNVHLSLKIEERKILQSNFSLQEFIGKNNKTYQVVYFDKDMIRDNLCDKFLYDDELKSIFYLLLKYINKDDLAKKYKPGRNTKLNKKRINYGVIIDDYVPAEFLINSNVKLYLGMTSMAMSNIEKGNIISLVNLVTYLDPIKKERSVYNLEKRKKVNKIYYPNSIIEFEKLLHKFLKIKN